MKTLEKAASAAVLFAALSAHAQIVTDGSVGARVTLSGRNVQIAESLGIRAGGNLLHSFSIFNVGVGERATFAGTGFVQNIIARITGGSASRIEGTVASAIPGSNLFLVNPSGIVFGPGASIDVPGSFHASTGHYLSLADGTRIATTATPDVTLTFAPPAAFGFEGAAAPILLQGAQLRVAEGRRISLSGGDVTLEASGTRASSLIALSGSVEVAATGRLSIRENSVISVNEGAGRQGAGSISLTGREVALDRATLASITTFSAGRGISIAATEALTVNASDVLSVTRGAGDAGSLSLRGRDITLSGGSLVDTSCDPGCTRGAGGALTVTADRNLEIRGDNPDRPTYLVSNTFGGGRTGAIAIRAPSLTASGNALVQGVATATSTGDGTNITLTTGSIALSDGAQIDVSTRGPGRGGTLTVNNSGNIRIEGTRVVSAATGNKAPSGFFSNTESSGIAGGIVVSTGSLEILGGGEISSSARRGSTGGGGRIAIAATGAVRVAGTDADLKSSGIVSNTFSGSDAGDIEIVADLITVEGRARIQVQSEGAGRAGSARLRSRTLALSGQGQVSSDTRSTGAGGSLDVEVAETLAIDGGDSGLFAKTYAGAAGGSVTVRAGDIRLSNGGGIFAGTDGTGRGGNLAIRAARTIDIASDASISVESRATGLAGSIEVRADDSLAITGGGRITTSARQADGGDIRVSAGRFGFMDGGRITTEVGTGQGSGGNVDLRIPTLVTRGSTITANAFGGDGGNIYVGTTTFLPSPDTRITASSTLGIDGTITFASPALDPTGELLVPAPAFVDAGAILAGRCGPRLAGRASSLVLSPNAFEAPAPDAWRLASAPAWPQPLACVPAGRS